MNADREPTELILLPSLRAHRGPQGGFVMTQKYMNGAAAFARRWPGPVTSLVELNSMPSSDMDHVEVTPGAFETELELRADDPATLEQRIPVAFRGTNGGVVQAVGHSHRLYQRIHAADRTPDRGRRYG